MGTLQLLRYLTLRDIAPFGRNVIYAGNVMRNFAINFNRRLVSVQATKKTKVKKVIDGA